MVKYESPSAAPIYPFGPGGSPQPEAQVRVYKLGFKLYAQPIICVKYSEGICSNWYVKLTNMEYCSWWWRFANYDRKLQQRYGEKLITYVISWNHEYDLIDAEETMKIFWRHFKASEG